MALSKLLVQNSSHSPCWSVLQKLWHIQFQVMARQFGFLVNLNHPWAIFFWRSTRYYTIVGFLIRLSHDICDILWLMIGAKFVKNSAKRMICMSNTHQRWIFLVIPSHPWRIIFFFLCINIHIRVFHAIVFRFGCFVQKYLSGTVPRYTVRKVYTRKSNPNGPLNNGKEGATMY